MNNNNNSDNDNHDSTKDIEITLHKGFAEIKKDISSIKDDVEDLKNDIKKHNDAFYNPDNGLFQRLFKIDNQTNKQQQILDILGKIFYIAVGSGFTLIIKVIFGV